MNQKLFISIIIFLIGLIQGQAPWPQYDHDFQYSNRANLGIPFPSSNLCPKIFNDQPQVLLTLIPDQDTLLMVQLPDPDEKNRTTVFSSSTYERIGSYGISAFATDQSGDIIFYLTEVEDGLKEKISLGAVSSIDKSIIWERDLEYTDNYYNEPKIAYNNIANAVEVMMQTTNSQVIYFHLDATTGKTSWMYTFPALSGGIYTDFDFYGADPATGNPIIGIISSSPTSSGSLTYFVNVFCFESSNGRYLWGIDPSYFDYFAMTKPIISDNGIAIFGNNATIYGFSVGDGSLVWEQEKLGEVNIEALLQGSNSAPSPVVITGTYFTDNFINFLEVIDPSTGNVLVSMPRDVNLAITGVVSIGNSIVVSGYADRGLVCRTHLVDLSQNQWNGNVISEACLESMLVGGDGTVYGVWIRGNTDPLKFAGLVPC